MQAVPNKAEAWKFLRTAEAAPRERGSGSVVEFHENGARGRTPPPCGTRKGRSRQSCCGRAHSRLRTCFDMRQACRTTAGCAAYHDDVASGRTPWTIDRSDGRRRCGSAAFRTGPGLGLFEHRLPSGHAPDRTRIGPASGRCASPTLCFPRQALRPPGSPARLRIIAGVNMGDAVGYDPGWVYHGLITGTVAEAAHLLDRLLAGNLLAPHTLRRMLEPRPLPQHRNARHPDPAYGLGLMLWATRPEHHAIGHSGSGPGSSIAVYGRRGSTRVVWSASSSGVDPEEEVFRALGSDEA